MIVRRFVRCVFPAVLVLLSAAPPPASAQSKKPVKLLDLIEVPRVSDPRLSSDGHQVLFVLDRPDWKQGKRIGHIWRINADGSAPLQLTTGDQGEQSPRWSPEGRRIAFVAKRGDNEFPQIYLLDNAGGEARQLSKHATAPSSISWAPDGTAVYFVAADPKSADEKDRDKAKDDVFAFEETYKQKHLWTVSTKDGAETRLTSGDFSVLEYAVSRDGRRIVTQRAPTPLLDDEIDGEVWVMDATGANAVALTKNHIAERASALSPDGSQVLFIADANGAFDPYYNGTLFLVPTAGGPAQPLLPTSPYEVERAAWGKDARAIYYVANMGVRSELFELDLDTRVSRRLTAGDHSLQGWTFTPEAGRHLMQIDEPTRFGDVWTLPAAGSGAPIRVTGVYDYLDRDYRIPRQERIEWKGADGVTVEGLLYYPLDHTPGVRYPLVVQTHGGPQASDKFGWSGGQTSYVQVLAAMGYAVLKPNYRGSTGYGNAFLRDMVGQYFRNAHLDVIAGVDHLIALGIADPERLVAMGWSAGGHMTNKLITVTNRFKAAASGAGAANWISMYAQSDVRIDRTMWFGGTPWERNGPIEVYWNNSPLKQVAAVTTPTIFLVGEQDARVPLPQSVEMYRALRSNGVATHLYVAPREPHGWSELRHVLFKMNVELDWFEKHANARSYTWERAPAENAAAAVSKPTAHD